MQTFPCVAESILVQLHTQNFPLLNTHIYRKHRERLTDLSITNSTNKDDLNDEVVGLDTVPTYDDANEPVFHAVNQLLQVDHHEQLKISSKFLMKLKDCRGMSQVAINDVVEGSQTIFSHTVSRLKAWVEEKLTQHGIDIEQIDGLQELFSTVQDPFAGIHTPYLQQKFIASNFGYIVSCQNKYALHVTVQWIYLLFCVFITQF